MYPLKFRPIYKNMIWGGDKISTYLNRELPSKDIGESWEVSCRKNGISVIDNGNYKDFYINQVIFNEKFLGSNFKDATEFPLLIKIIDANENLSIQVHPNDEYATENENCTGKTEMWYILDAPENSFLIIGLNSDITKEIFIDSLNKGNIEDNIYKLFIKKGDVINIPAGLVHAITKGVMLLEVQQNCDITYRVFDYNRIGNDGNKRELHIEKAIEVIDFENKLKKEVIEGLEIMENNTKFIYYIANKYFGIIKYEIKENLQDFSDEKKFFILNCIEGSCSVEGEGFNEQLNFGDTLFIPAYLGKYKIVGNCSILKVFVPNIETDFFVPLIKAGYSRRTICDVLEIEF